MIHKSIIRTDNLWCMFLFFGGLMHEKVKFYQHMMIVMTNQNSVSSIICGWVIFEYCDVWLGFQGFYMECVLLETLVFMVKTRINIIN